MSEFEVFLNLAYIAENVRDLILETNDIALCEYHFDILLVQFLQSTDNAV